MRQKQNDSRHSDESDAAVTGEFADRRSAELAAEAALKNGFTVQLVDKVVSVRPQHSEHAAEAEAILAAYGATNLPDVRASMGSGERVRADRGGVLELVEEDLQPRKETVVGGELLIRKKVVNETVSIEVPIEREELVIERVPVQRNPADQAVTSEPDPLLQALATRLRDMHAGEVVRIPLVEEQVVVHKDRVVTSELVVGKRLIREVQRFEDQVRRQVAKIDRRGDVRVADVEEHA